MTTPAPDATNKCEPTPWLLLGAALVTFVLLALATVPGALASNRAASASYRAAQERALAAIEGAGLDQATVERGRAAYLSTCIACHGPNGEALPKLGKDLAHSEFVAAQSDAQLALFVKVGRPTWDPLNTTKVDMPGKGGNPRLTDPNIADIVQYLRFLQAMARL